MRCARTTFCLRLKITGLDFAPELASDPTVHALAISEFVLEDVGDGLRSAVDGRLSFDPVTFLINALLPLMSPNFKILKPKRHNPRISIDRLIISRESWSFSSDELTFANEPDAETRFWSASMGDSASRASSSSKRRSKSSLSISISTARSTWKF